MNFKIVILLLTLVLIDPTKISKINNLKADSRQAFNAGRYKEASLKYRYLIDSLDVNEDAVKLNLAHANYLAKDTANARIQYQDLTQSTNTEIRSKAYQQLGLMSNSSGKSEEALARFKQAIKANPANEDARYNYEMLKKKSEEKKRKDQQKNNEDKNKPQTPSEFAKKLKAKADALAAEFKFSDAHSLMSEGAKKDNSVTYYSDFINRLNDVVTINKAKK